MKRYAFTGPTHLTLSQRAFVYDSLSAIDLGDAGKITTGGAPGTDVLVADRCLDLYPYARHQIVVPQAAYAEDAVVKLVTKATALGVFLEVIQTEPGDEPYRVRNHRMLDLADELVAFLRSPTFYRSGEWMTTNIAKKLDIPIQQVILP